jgi:hypothetical protein
VVRVLVLVLLLSGCNAYIGIPTDVYDQPWYFLSIFSFVSLITLPFVSTFFVFKAVRKNVVYKAKVQKYLNYSLILLIALNLLMEMSLPPKTNLRFDLFITIPALIWQVSMVISSWYKQGEAENF